MAQTDGVGVDFLRDIKPVLKDRCYACHGALKQNSSLRLDTAQSVLTGGESGPAIVPGKSGESLLIEAVTGDLAVWRMPPEGEALTAKQIDLLRRWIDLGAPVPAHEEPEPAPTAHWAFQPPVRPALPAVTDIAGKNNPIDRLIAAEHERLGLRPAQSAARHVLLRRAYLDLVGVPPTRDQWQAFFSDNSPQAYEKVVEQLLDSPAYGQRWARHWMDIWRYSDWSGENKNLVRGSPQHIWQWRDWIVESLNGDKPYDRMVSEMLAGDEIAPGDHEIVRATGFLARNWYEFNRNVWLDDTVEHTAKAFVGLTLNCARCHDHKFDPVSQQEYYAWRAVFEPHDIRIDPLPGEPDIEKAGIPRVYDKQADTPTYLFVRGEETRPDKEHPLAPATPTVLGGRFEVTRVSLPLEISYPAMRPGACEEMIARAEAELSEAEAGVQAAESSTEQAGPALSLARLRLAAAEAELSSINARIGAERLRMTSPIASESSIGDAAEARWNEMATAAAAAERLAELRKAEFAAAESEQKFAGARQRADSSQGNKKAAATASSAEKEMKAAQKSLASAQAAIKRTDAKYSPLGPKYPETSTGRRLALARWITDRANPLAARVAVNHVWMRHFGEPLVDPVDDFGRRTPRPQLQLLLDWLAVEFMESGWSLKHLHRLIVTSNAYRMSSTAEAAEENARLDPANRYLWRMNSRRVEGEVIRDSILHVAGNLDTSAGGPEIALDQAETSLRRSLYFRHAHERKTPFLEVFDSADVLDCYRRSITVLPQQALALANSLMPYTQSRHLAQKLTAESAAASDTDFVRLAFEHVLTRSPTDVELARCLEFLQADTMPDQPADQARLEARSSVIHALFNHNEFITIR